MALALGAHVTLVTNLPVGCDRSPFDGLLVQVPEAGASPEYENRYDGSGNRTQFLYCEGHPLPPGVLAHAAGADVLLLAPAYHELDAVEMVSAPVLGIELQGVLRTRDALGRVGHRPQRVEAARPFALMGSWLFLSDEDTADAAGFARVIAQSGAQVLLTHGVRGATLFEANAAHAYPARAASPVDPTGAGDAFAATFLVRLAESGNRREALRWALAAGALATEGRGVAGIPRRAAVEARACEEAA